MRLALSRSGQKMNLLLRAAVQTTPKGEEQLTKVCATSSFFFFLLFEIYFSSDSYFLPSAGASPVN